MAAGCMRYYVDINHSAVTAVLRERGGDIPVEVVNNIVGVKCGRDGKQRLRLQH